MSSGDFSNLVIRNITSYNPDGSFVAAGNVFTVGANGKQVWTTDLTLSTLSVLSLSIQSTLNLDNLIADNFTVHSTATVSSLVSKNAVIGSTLSVSSITTTGLQTSTLLGSTIHATSAVFDSSITVTTLTVRGDLNVSTLHGSTLTTGSEIVISSLTVGMDIYADEIYFSTMVGSSIRAHDVSTISTLAVGSQLTTNTLVTLQTANMGAAVIQSSLSVGSTLTAPMAGISTLIASSFAAQTGMFQSSLVVTSSLTAGNMMVVSSFQVGRTLQVTSSLLVSGPLQVSNVITAQSLSVSTSVISTLSANAITIGSTLSVGSTITTGGLGFSTLIGSTITTNTIRVMSSAITSTLSTGTLSTMVMCVSSIVDLTGVPFVAGGGSGKTALVCSNLPLSLERLTIYVDRATGKLTFSSLSSFSTIYKVEYFAYNQASSVYVEGYDVPSAPLPIQGLQFPVPNSLSLAQVGSWCSAYVTDMTLYDASWNVNATCLRTGANGNDLYSLDVARVLNAVTLTTPPDVPTLVSAQLYPAGDPTGIMFTFSAPTTTGGFISCYEAYASNGTTVSQIGTTSPILVQGLVAGSLYTLSVLARNAKGQSAQTPATPNTLVYKTKPGAPTTITQSLYPAGAATGININFTYPTNTGGGIDKYYATLLDVNGIQPSTVVSSVTTPIYVAPPAIVQGTTYALSMYSQNAGGQSAAATASSNLFFQVLPSAPTITSYVIYPSGLPGIQINFTAPVNNGGGITSYTLRAYTAVGSILTSAVTGTNSPLTVTGLSAGTLYSLKVFATNNAGNGPESAQSVILYGEPPGAPALTALSLDPVGNPTGALVTYTAPSFLGGGITYYKATAYDGVTPVSYASTLNGTVAPLKLVGLTAGTLYTISVVAENNIAPGQPSNTSTILYKTLPSAPLTVAGSLDPVGAANGILVSYGYPLDLGGGVDYYTATAYDTTNIQPTVSATSTSNAVKLTGLVPGTTYRFTTTATNTGGTSAGGSSISNLLFQIPPTAPSIATTTLSPAGNPTGIAVVSNPPSNLGGGINTYTTMAYSSNTIMASSISTTTTAFISSLTAGTSYTFKSFATNTGGSGPSSIASAPIVYKTLPSLPTNVAGSLYPVGAATGMNVSFNYPSDLGGGVDSYTVKAYDSSSINPTISTTGATSPLYLSAGLVPGTTYRFTTLATNAGGSTAEATSAATLLFQNVLNMPASITASLSTLSNPSAINVAITAPSDASQGVDSYFVGAYNGGGTLVTSLTGGPSVLNYTLSTFTAGITYTIKANAVNTAGAGLSNSTTITYYTKPAAPTNVVGTLRSVGATTYIDVSFTASTDTGGGALMYYVTAVDKALVQPNVAGSGSSSPITLSAGLVAGTTYRFTVYCQNPSVSSDVAMSTTDLPYFVIPTAPQNVVPVLYPAGNPTSVRVTFNPITTVGGITNYTSYAYTQPGGAQLTSLTNSGTTHDLSGFTAGTQYDIRVKATNPAGTGPLSVSTLLTYYTKPTAPAITAVALDPAAAPTGVNVTFTAPANTGGGIINYVVSAFNGATLTATVNGSASPLKLTSLTAGINYTFSVVAVNPGGSTSSVTSNLTYYTQPSVPRTVTATVGHDIGSGKASLTWVEPSDKGGGTMEYQLIARTTSGGTVAYTSAWITTFSNIATGLTDGTSYTFTVYARNTTVTTLINSATATATPYDLPPIPTGLTATSGSNGSVPLTWSVPSSTPAVDKYLITMTNNTTGVSTTNTSTTNSYTWSGLTNGTTYSFKVAASNNNGANYSDPSSSVSATPYTTPSAPSLSVSLGELVANLSWSVPADNGSAIQYYRVSKDGTTWSANIAATTTTYTFTTVASTNYTFYVQAYNAAGWGSSGTNSQSIPAPPAAISITHVYAGINNTVVSGVSVAWTGGSGYTSMELHGWSTFSDSYAGGGAVYGNPTNTVGIEGWDVYVWLIAINAGGRTVSGIEWA